MTEAELPIAPPTAAESAEAAVRLVNLIDRALEAAGAFETLDTDAATMVFREIAQDDFLLRAIVYDWLVGTARYRIKVYGAAFASTEVGHA